MQLGPERIFELPRAELVVWSAVLRSSGRHERRQEARSMLRELLAEQLRTAPEDLQLGRAASGKPQLADGRLSFNLSHSGEVACVATSPAVAVGVDVERVRAFKHEAGMRRRICTPAELKLLQKATDPVTELIRLWVRKESVVKASGEGIVRDMNQLEVLDAVVEDGAGRSWECVELPPPADGYLAAVAFGR